MDNGVGGDDSQGRSKTVPSGMANAVEVEKGGGAEGRRCRMGGGGRVQCRIIVNLARDMGGDEQYHSLLKDDH